MARVIWTIPALNDLERILEYIELDNETAARRLAKKAFHATDKLAGFPESGSKPKELRGTPYRRMVVGPLIMYYRKDNDDIYIVHVRRGERQFSMSDILKQD